MILQFLKTMSRSSAKHVGFAAALVCTLGATEVGAHQGLSFDTLGNEFEDMLKATAKRQLSNDIMLAQNADDCGCDDAENYGDDYADEYTEDYDEDYDDEYAEDYEGNYANDQGLSDEQQQRLNQALDRQVQVIEKTILWRDPLGPGYY